jgi:hypothetical protein
MRRDQIDFQPLESLSQRVAVVSLVGDQSHGSLSGPSPPAAGDLDRFERFFSQVYFGGRCREQILFLKHPASLASGLTRCPIRGD